jgi:UDP-glucose 4-epimerase
MKTPFHALVTGGAGFIGSHLVDALVHRGCTVTVLDNLSSGRKENLAGVAHRIRFMEGDIREMDDIERAVTGCDVVFHEAALVSVPQTVEDPLGSTMVNDVGTLQVLEASRRSGVRRVVLASSSAVYGDDPRVPKEEGMSMVPLSPYAAQKAMGEYHARVYQRLYGVETVCLRYFNVYGPRQDPSSPYSGVISIFLTRAGAGRSAVIYGDGRQYRDFVFVADVVAANLLAVAVPEAAGRCLNVGTGSHVRIDRLWEMVCDLNGVGLPASHDEARPGDIVESVADITQARRVLGYEPAFSFEEGLRRTWEWYTRGAADDSATAGWGPG